MALKEVASVFSRRFIVGFFIPVFFAAFALAQLVDERALPDAYRTAKGATPTLIIGGFALLVGLLLSGLHYSVLRFLEGYWLIRTRIVVPRSQPTHAVARTLQRVRSRALDALYTGRHSIGTRMTDRWIRRQALVLATRKLEERSPERTAAAMELDRRYPAVSKMLPTEFGNAIRAFETHPRGRYALDGIAVWPRISAMLTDGERGELEDAETDLAFWVNALMVVTIGGGVLFLERIWHRPGGVVETLAVEVAVIVATTTLGWMMYRQAIAAAVRWGDPVRAAFDVHRLGLYDSLGVRRPATRAEDEVAGEALGRLIWFAEPIPDELRAPPSVAETPEGDSSRSTPGDRRPASPPVEAMPTPPHVPAQPPEHVGAEGGQQGRRHQ